MRCFILDAENIMPNIFFTKDANFKKDDIFFIVGNKNISINLEALSILKKYSYKIHCFGKTETSTKKDDYADKLIFALLGKYDNNPNIDEFFIVSNDAIFSEKHCELEVINKPVTRITSMVSMKNKDKEFKFHTIAEYKENKDLIIELVDKYIKYINKALSDAETKSDFYSNLEYYLRSSDVGNSFPQDAIVTIYRYYKKKKFFGKVV